MNTDKLREYRDGILADLTVGEREQKAISVEMILRLIDILLEEADE